MPRIRQSSTVNLQGWQPAPAATNTVTATTETQTPQRSAFMHASMPVMATTSDAFVRQFYGLTSIPQTRILPAKKGTTP